MSHPEFGSFCPAPRLRREVRVAFFAIAFGALIGSIAVTALSTRARNPEAESATVGSALVPKRPQSLTGKKARARLTRSLEQPGQASPKPLTSRRLRPIRLRPLSLSPKSRRQI